jgi:transcriptional regulator with XRE-family HTH domain
MDYSDHKTIHLLARNLRALMESHPTLNTQQKVARKAGIAQASVSRVLRLEQAVTLRQLESLADAFKVPVADLLKDESDKSAIHYDRDGYAALPMEDKAKIESYIAFVVLDHERRLKPDPESEDLDLGLTFRQVRDLPEPLRSVVRRAAQRELDVDSPGDSNEITRKSKKRKAL